MEGEGDLNVDTTTENGGLAVRAVALDVVRRQLRAGYAEYDEGPEGVFRSGWRRSRRPRAPRTSPGQPLVFRQAKLSHFRHEKLSRSVTLSEPGRRRA